MSDVISVEQEQQEQEYTGDRLNLKLRCENCNLSFNSDKSLEVHLFYHEENLLRQWSQSQQQQQQQQQQQESNNNNNNKKADNHNRYTSVKQETVIAPVNKLASKSSSQDPTSSQQQQSQDRSVSQTYSNFLSPISYLREPNKMSHAQNISLNSCHSYSPSHEDIQNSGGGSGGGSGGAYPRFHPYQSQHFSSEHTTASSTSPHSPFQCEKCGSVYEDGNQLIEHLRTSHSDSPSTYPPVPQYHQLGSSPQQQDQQQQAQPLRASPSHSNQPQQASYDYNGGQAGKLDMKQEPEEQAEILDLDSHKVQTHRYEEEIMRYQQQHHQHQQEFQMQMHQQQVMHQQQQRIGPHSIGSVLTWPSQAHEYSGLPGSMGPIDGLPPIDQPQFMRSQHLTVVDPPVHQGAILTNAQPMPGHQMSTGLLQQPPKSTSLTNQSWKSNEPRRPKTYNCIACNKWFTSSGHLKRHYNTTLHKNAVKQSKMNDPANEPISTHHHPSRDNNIGPSTSVRGSSVSTRSPDLTSSGSPPNLMAGPSGEATGGLLHTATTLYNNHSSSSSSSNSNDSSAVVILAQKQQQGPSSVRLVSRIQLPLSSPQQSSMVGHHQQQMGSPSHQMGLQQQQQQQQPQQLHHLPMSSSEQLHHSMTSSMHPPSTSHMNSLSAMGSSSHPHHVNLSSAITSVHPVITSVPPSAMGGTTMPHQPYPNAMPPHVTSTISIQGLLEPIPITTIGNDQSQQHHQQQQQQKQEDMLPGFGTFSSHHQRPLANFTLGLPGYQHQQPQAVNVGGLSSEETAPQENNPSGSGYELYDPSSPYEMVNMNVAIIANTNNMAALNIQNGQPSSHSFPQPHEYREHNNNISPMIEVKVDMNADRNTQPKRGRKGKAKSKVLKEQQMTADNARSFTPPRYASSDGVHKCLECQKYFNRACYLTQHNKSFHMGAKPYKCGQCGKRFPNVKDHENHLSKHAGDKPYKCVKCPKQFNHKTDLRRHTCLHTGEKPFICKECGKGFIRKDHMMKHSETHKKKINGRFQKENVRATTAT